MKATRKNFWLMLVVALPLLTLYEMNTWQFWVLITPAYAVLGLVTRALPVCVPGKYDLFAAMLGGITLK